MENQSTSPRSARPTIPKTRAVPATKEQLKLMWLWWNKYLDIRAFLVFQRIQRFYSTFVVLAALVSGLAIAALTFPEFHPGTGLSLVGEGFLCSSAITGVVSAILATMLLFSFEGLERASRLDLAVAWSPLVLLDLSVFEFLVGTVCWYAEKNARWRGAVMATQLTGMLGLSIALSVWMWFHMSKKGGLGREEREAGNRPRRGADE
jgi:hypothetical protein